MRVKINGQLVNDVAHKGLVIPVGIGSMLLIKKAIVSAPVLLGAANNPVFLGIWIGGLLIVTANRIMKIFP